MVDIEQKIAKNLILLAEKVEEDYDIDQEYFSVNYRNEWIPPLSRYEQYIEQQAHWATLRSRVCGGNSDIEKNKTPAVR